MIARLVPEARQDRDTPYLRFLEALADAGFEGDIALDHANRTVLATDNSIYQRLPRAVLYPRDAADLERTARLAGRDDFRRVVLPPPAAAAPAPTASHSPTAWWSMSPST